MAHILLVDDDLHIRNVFGEWLEKAGHTVSMAENGTAALASLDKHRFDVLLLDIVMPDHDGFEIILRLANREERPEIIVMTGGSARLNLDFIVSVSRQLPVADILIKPFGYDALKTAIDKALQQLSP